MDRRTFAKSALLGGAALAGFPAAFAGALSNPTMAGIKASDFGQDFIWGCASAAYQIEGAWNADGKGPSIWDDFTHQKGNIHDGSNADVGADFYNRYADDLALLKSMRFGNYRFSVAWSRVLPHGTGTPNRAGLDFYHRVIDSCLQQGITPWITMYHWDLPLALHQRGGWPSREVVGWFAEYANLITREYGDKVKNWMVLNEPSAFVGLGYGLGLFAPGIKSVKKFIQATHHAVLCQAEGGRIARANVAGANVGTTFACSPVYPYRDKDKHDKAVTKINVLRNRIYAEPALGLGYPTNDLAALRPIEKHIQPGDEEKMAFDFDFIGIQNYSRVVAKKSLTPPVLWAKEVSAQKREVEEVNELGNEYFPQGIYEMLKQFGAYKNAKRIIVTENGTAEVDVLKDGKVADRQRTKFFQEYLANVLKAKKEGVPVEGYFVWTLTDNFEWAEGYKPRFGIVYVDFATQQRYMKDSGYWWQQFLQQ